MEVSTAESGVDDLQAVFSSHAEYHLARAENGFGHSLPEELPNSLQKAGLNGSETAQTLKQEVPTTVIDDMKSTLSLTQPEHNISVTYTNKADEKNNTMVSRKDEARNSAEADYFGSESSVFSLTEETSYHGNIDGIQLVDSEGIADDLAEVGLNEQNLEELAHSSSNAIQPENMTVHPVGLKKCNVTKNVPTTTPEMNVDPCKVTTLLDLSSIGELKRLWNKAESSTKKSKTAARPVSQLKPVKDLSNVIKKGEITLTTPKRANDIVEQVTQKSSNTEFSKSKKVIKTPKVILNTAGKPSKSGNVVKKLTKPFETKITNSASSKASKRAITILNFKIKYCTKPCSVRLKKLENMDLNKENVKIDLTIAKPFAQIDTLRGRPSNLSKKVIAKVSEKFGSKSSKDLESVIRFVTKSLTKVACGKKCAPSSNKSSEKNKCVNILPTPKQSDKLPKKIGRPKGVAKSGQKSSKKNVIESEEILNKFTSVTSEGETTQNVQEDDLYQTESFPDYINNDFDIDDDNSDDDYLPSEDEFKPSKKENLKNAFTKSPSKMKKKFTKSKSISKTKLKKNSGVDGDIKQEIKTETNQDDTVQKVRKYVRSGKISNCRIGRPPVLGHFECKMCDFTANEKNLVDKHYAKAHARKWLNCGYCDAKFRAKNTLWEHEAYNHTNEKPFKCKHEDCDYASKNPTDLKRHQAKHAIEKCYSCEICGWRTKWHRNMKHHHIMKHNDERKYKCDLCPFTAKRTTDLKQHMYRHSEEKPISCLTCGFKVKTNWELRSHMLIHSNEKPFKCTFPGCKGATKTNADLTKHMRIHTTERKFECELCQRTYKDRQSLNKHHSYMHTTTRPFSCDTCGRAFKCKPALAKHMVLHTGIKPHKCSTCGKAFANTNNMKMHMKTHDAKDRPYKCPLCPYLAREPGHLLPHIGTFHRDSYAYFCEICRKPFNRYLQLQTHLKRMHTQKEIDNLENTGQIDLALLKMEMNLDLEKVERDRKRGKKSRSKSVPKGMNNEDEIKQEPINEEYGDIELTKRETVKEITDVRLNEETGQIEVVKGSESGNTEKVISEFQLETNSQTSGSLVNTDVCDMLTESSVTDVENEKFYDTEIEEMESEQIELNGGLKSSVNNEQEFDKNILEKAKNVENEKLQIGDDEKNWDTNQGKATATLAMIEGFRLPLATKGFQFNYFKTGKKPVAWYMDTSVMCAQDAEKQNAYLRRKGLKPPLPKGLPKGHKKKKTLNKFLKERTKKRNENIMKSNFIKGIGLVSKTNESRTARFKGSYSQFENLEGDELSVYEVREILPKIRISEKVIKSQFDKSVSPKLKSTKKQSQPMKPKKKDVQKKVTKKVLLSSEKQKKSKSSNGKMTIRKPKYINGAEKKAKTTKATSRRTERDSFAALESIINEVSEQQTIAKSNEKIKKVKLCKKQNQNTKFIEEQKALMNEKSKMIKGNIKQKYNMKYVPVKKQKKRKSAENDSSVVSKRLKAGVKTKKRKTESHVMNSVGKGSKKIKTKDVKKKKVVTPKKRNLKVKISKGGRPRKEYLAQPKSEVNTFVPSESMMEPQNINLPLENSYCAEELTTYSGNLNNETNADVHVPENSIANEFSLNNLVDSKCIYDDAGTVCSWEASPVKHNVSSFKLDSEGMTDNSVHPVMLTHTPVKSRESESPAHTDTDCLENEAADVIEDDSKSIEKIPRVNMENDESMVGNNTMNTTACELDDTRVGMDTSEHSDKEMMHEEYAVMVKREPSVEADYFTSVLKDTKGE